MAKEIITTCTRDCPNSCGLVATVEQGRVTGLRGNPRHPLTRGQACHKCMRFVARAYSPERVLTPLKKNAAGEWRPVSWPDALEEMAARLAGTVERYGPEGILYYRGFAQRTALKLFNERFFNLIGGVTGTRGTLCGGTGQASQNLDFGCRISHDPLDHLNSNSLVLWGRNPVATNPTLAAIAGKLRSQGAPVALIDPVASESRRLCDLYIQPAPGRDVFLAMAVAKLILERGQQDEAFLAERSEGFAAYDRILAAYSPEELLRLCDVPRREAEKLYDMLVNHYPTAICLGWGFHRWAHAHYAIRAVDALGAIAGIVGVSGGGVSQGFEEYAAFDWGVTLDHLHPGRRRLLMPLIGREMAAAQDPPLGMAVITAGNPVCQAANSARVADALRRIPFVAYVGHFLDDTAQCADIFLPTTTFLEEEDVTGSYGHNFIGPVNPAVLPPGEAKSDFTIFQELAGRFPFAGEMAGSAAEWLERLLQPVISRGVPLAEIRRGPVRLPEAPYVPYADGRFPTPSGRYRFMGEFSPPPSWRPDPEYPYQLMSVAPYEWLCSETTPAEQGELTPIRVHPEEAAKCGAGEGEEVTVVSRVGRTGARLVLDPRQRRDVVVFPRGRWLGSGSSANLLTPDLVSEVGEGAPFYEARVRLEKAGPAGR
jgi:anaerobic selenocysteine-containing dehydrogenase